MVNSAAGVLGPILKRRPTASEVLAHQRRVDNADSPWWSRIGGKGPWRYGYLCVEEGDADGDITLDSVKRFADFPFHSDGEEWAPCIPPDLREAELEQARAEGREQAAVVFVLERDRSVMSRTEPIDADDVAWARDQVQRTKRGEVGYGAVWVQRMLAAGTLGGDAAVSSDPAPVPAAAGAEPKFRMPQTARKLVQAKEKAQEAFLSHNQRHGCNGSCKEAGRLYAVVLETTSAAPTIDEVLEAWWLDHHLRDKEEEVNTREMERLKTRIRQLDGDASPIIARVREALYADTAIRDDFDALMAGLRYWHEQATLFDAEWKELCELVGLKNASVVTGVREFIRERDEARAAFDCGAGVDQACARLERDGSLCALHSLREQVARADAAEQSVAAVLRVIEEYDGDDPVPLLAPPAAEVRGRLSGAARQAASARAAALAEAAAAVKGTKIEHAHFDCDECGEVNRWPDAAGTLREAAKNVKALARAEEPTNHPGGN